MIALIQRVAHAAVVVNEQVVGQIGSGLLVLLGVEKMMTNKKQNGCVRKYLVIEFLVMNREK